LKPRRRAQGIVGDTKQAADYYGVSTRLLEKWRVTGGGPTFIKIGRRVLYRQSDLDDFLERNTFRSTSDGGV